jgi:hypothetical protein
VSPITDDGIITFRGRIAGARIRRDDGYTGGAAIDLLVEDDGNWHLVREGGTVSIGWLADVQDVLARAMAWVDANR